jgi:hypothetical protein
VSWNLETLRVITRDLATAGLPWVVIGVPGPWRGYPLLRGKVLMARPHAITLRMLQAAANDQGAA